MSSIFLYIYFFVENFLRILFSLSLFLSSLSLSFFISLLSMRGIRHLSHWVDAILHVVHK